MHRAKRPYWLGSLDRWNVLVIGVLVVLLIVLNARGLGRAPQEVAPTMPPPVAGTALLAGQPGIISGTAAPNAQVRVLDGDVPLGETTADASGAWRLAVPALSPGTHTLISQELDANGNVVATSEPLTVTVSEPTSIAGNAPEIKLPAAGLKADTPLTLEGSGTPGTTVQVYDGDQVVGETVVAPDGTWKITLPPLTLGAHNLVAKLLGADGKEQSASAPVELTVADGQIVVATPVTVAEATAVTAPTAGKAPEIELPAAALKAGEPIELEGTGEPGTTVTLYDGDQVVAETVVAPDGTWTLTVPPLAAGTHSLVAKQVGADGKEQAASTPIELTVADGQVVVTTPAPPAAVTAVPVADAPAIKLPAAGLKATEPLTLEGTGTPGTTVTVYDGDEVVGETVVAPDGTWQITLPPPAAGAHSLVAKQVGADGKAQAASAPVELTVADGQIVVATPAVVAAATPATGAATAVTSVTPVAGNAPAIKRPAAAALKVGEPVVLEGTGEPGTTVTLYDGDQVVAETVVAPDGTWTITVPPLAAGTHSLAAKLLGAGGKEQAASAPIELTVADGQIVVATPAAVAQATAATGTATPVPGETAAATVEPTSVTAAPAATGTATPVPGETAAATVEPTSATAAPAATATPTGAVATTTEPTTAALAGAATAVATAATGLPSTAATPAVSAPMVATPVGAAENAGATMTLEGTGAPGTTVKVYDGDNLLGEATVGADGKWTMTMPTLAAGLHSLVAKLFGADGKEQATSPELSVTVSADPGAKLSVLPVINPPAGGKLSAGGVAELAGTAAPGTLIKLFDGGNLVGEATADETGNWQMVVPQLAAGEHTLTAITYGADGEVQASSKPLTVVVSEPEPAAATGPAAQPKIGWPPDGSTVVSARPLVAGQSFPRGVVRIYDGATLLGETIADANGYWSFRPSVALTAGEHVLIAVATSADGLATTTAPPVTITVRSRAVTIPSWKPSAGAAPTVVTPENGDTIHTVQPLFAGTAAPNSKVRLYDGDLVMGETAVDADGRWTFRPTAPLAEGEHAIAVAPLNADGSEGAPKDTVTIVIASGLGTAPGGSGIIVDSTPATIANSRPVLTGQAPAGTTIRIYDGDQLVGEVKAGPDGGWYYVPAAPLTAGLHVLHFEVVDADGNVVTSADRPLTVATGATAVKPPQITTPAQGQVAPGDVLSGSAPAGSQVKIYDGSTLIGGTTAGRNGKWRFRLPGNLTVGSHEIYVVAVGQTGSPVSQSQTVVIVLVPPRTLPVTGAAARS